MIVWIKKRKFNEIVQKNLDNLLQLAYMKCKDKELAEDLVQETCLKAYKSFLEKEVVENPKAWLFRILINTHIDHTRKKQPSLSAIDNLDFVDNKNPQKDAETNFFFQDLHQALNELDSQQRTVVYLSDVSEYSYKEISELLDIPLGTVMSRLHRARQTLRKVLTEKGYSKQYSMGGEK